MSNVDEFWVQDIKGNFVPAKYLMYKGEYVFDPNQYRANKYPIFSSQAVNSEIPYININGLYPFVVPRDYSIESSLGYAEGLRKANVVTDTSDLALMNDILLSKQYRRGGSRDFQRTFDGSKGEAVQAFRDIANWDPGFVSAIADVSLFDLKTRSRLRQSNREKYSDFRRLDGKRSG